MVGSAGVDAAEVSFVELTVEVRRFGLGDGSLLFLGLGLFFHAADNAASNGLALSFADAFLNGASIFTDLCGVFSLIMIILSFVKDDGATKDRVRSPHSGILISVFVLSPGVKA